MQIRPFFSAKKVLFFLFLHKNICCWYSEVPRTLLMSTDNICSGRKKKLWIYPLIWMMCKRLVYLTMFMTDINLDQPAELHSLAMVFAVDHILVCQRCKSWSDSPRVHTGHDQRFLGDRKAVSYFHIAIHMSIHLSILLLHFGPCRDI